MRIQDKLPSFQKSILSCLLYPPPDSLLVHPETISNRSIRLPDIPSERSGTGELFQYPDFEIIQPLQFPRTYTRSLYCKNCPNLGESLGSGLRHESSTALP